MIERPPGPMHDVIRRALEEIRIYSNYYGAIKTITAALLQSKENENNNTSIESSRQLSLERGSSASQIRNDPINKSIQTSNNNNSSSSGVNTQIKRSSFSQGVMQGVVVQGSSDNISKLRESSQKLILNRTQKFRLLLLRADAYSATKQHEKALEDAQAAFLLSHERSPEAQFIMGRELLRLLRIVESVNAFENAETLLLSSTASVETSFAEEITDEDFWAQRGFQLKDVERLKLNRQDMEKEEQFSCGKLITDNKNIDPSSISSNSLVSVVTEEETNNNNPELAQWRRLAKEAKALLKMRTSHILPINILESTLTLLDRRMSSVRNGIVACVENTTSRSFRLAGFSSPDAAFYSGMQFPHIIPPRSCGLALLHPRGWGGFVGSVCYEVTESGICCFFCFESSFMGSIKCGVRFASERRSSELSHTNLNFHNGSITGGSTSSASSSSEFISFKIPNPSLWLSTHTAPILSGRKLKVSGATRNNSRIVLFSVAEVLPVRLRSVELLTALEYAGPNVLKKMSAVNRRYRELINNLPPSMFYGLGRFAYPDYCLKSDRLSSPWIVHDKEPVKWNFIFEGRSLNKENYIVTDSTDPGNNILCFSGESTGPPEAIVFYGDRQCTLAQIKGSWLPFSSTLYISTPSGRTIASCFLNQESQLTLAWDGAGSKSKAEDIKYVMHRREPTRRSEFIGRNSSITNLSSLTNNNSSNNSNSFINSNNSGGGGGLNTSDIAGVALLPSTNSLLLSSPVLPTNRGTRVGSIETYAVWHPRRTSGGVISSNNNNNNNNNNYNQTNGGMELVAEVTAHMPIINAPVKGATVGEIKLFNGADALLITLMAYCRFQWEN